MGDSKKILKEVLEEVTPNEKNLKEIEKQVKEFRKKFDSQIKKLGINAKSFIGGSFAKQTVIKKEDYDVDLFIRFDKKYKENEISELTEKILKIMKENFSRIHGSRDYFKIEREKPFKFDIEIIPVIKISNPKHARNVTDLSYSHVNYLRKKKNKKILDEIRLTKAFCYANKCYGAESYIQGLSGYSLELLTHYYGSFMNFIKNIAKSKGKIFVDMEKHYRNKNIISMDLNYSKLTSPIILIDPTFKERNAAAALSQETFNILKKAANEFLKKPHKKHFSKKQDNLDEIKKNSKKNKLNFVFLKAETNKQEGDIAGSKLLKFYRHLNYEIEKFFTIKQKNFSYNNKQEAEYAFSASPKKELLLSGPPVIQIENAKKFKQKHKKVFIKNKMLFAKEKINFNLREFIQNWIKKNSRVINEMSIVKLEIVE